LPTSYSPAFGFWLGAAFDPALTNNWAPPLVENFTLLENALVGVAQVSIAGLSTFTLSKVNGGADNWREPVIQFTGALTAPCTVTVPNVPRSVGIAQNNTTGGQNVVLTTSAGTTITLPPTGAQFNYAIDASGNVTTPQIAVIGTATSDNAIAGQVGEVQQVQNAAPITMPVNAVTDVLSMPLAAGDWDVNGIIQYLTYAGGTLSGNLQAWINSVSHTVPTPSWARAIAVAGAGSSFAVGYSLPSMPTRLSLAAAGTAYLSGFVQGASVVGGAITSASVQGFMWARRAR
jgi:hypothetical protein